MKDCKKKLEKYGLGPFTPVANLPFPKRANMTAVELLAFLPNSVRCAEIVYRFISNGGTRHALWAIVNTYRDFPRPWDVNVCGVYIYKAMRGAGYDEWTVKKHGKWHDAVKDSWNERNMNVGDFRVPGDKGAASIPFKSLAVDVRSMPQGDAALDLTRMVQHCVQNPDEKWMYPQDYEQLLSRLGGPADVKSGHLDRVAFTTWNSLPPSIPRVWLMAEMDAATVASITDKIANPRKRNTNTSTTYRKSRQSTRTEDGKFNPLRRWTGTPVIEGQSTQFTPLAMRNRGMMPRPKKSRLIEEMIEEEQQTDENSNDKAPQYLRELAKYVAPPANVTPASETDLLLAFAAEGAVDETNLFDAYAFGGPRHLLPYRMLHDIEQPDSSDVSGWAENLRWAFEQRACFWHARETEGWSESPEHMDIIARMRIVQTWASDELLDSLAEVQHKGFEDYEEEEEEE